MKRKIRILSLFDGISCGMIAADRVGLNVDTYYASEIESNAIKVSNMNYPEIVQLGDITKITKKMLKEIMPIDIVIGGSPCQDFSAFKTGSDRKGLDGSKSKLFYYYLRVLKFVNPRYFLLENVVMKKEDEDTVSDLLGVNPIRINSSLVSAQERDRLYWTNINVRGNPEDKAIVLRDIVQSAKDIDGKYWYAKPYVYNGKDKKIQCTLDIKGMDTLKRVFNLNYKCNTLTCDGNGGHRQKKVFQDGRCRKLTPVEYERLQTLPDNYTTGISDSARYTVIGNGWTVDVIAHIFSFLPDEYFERR